MKRFSIIDGAGLVYWQRAGLKVALISGHASEGVVHRFRALGIEEIHVGVKDKLAIFLDVLSRHGLQPRRGRRHGRRPDGPRAAASARASRRPSRPRTKSAAASRTTSRSGRPGTGAVREVIELILRAQGRLDAIVEPYRS